MKENSGKKKASKKTAPSQKNRKEVLAKLTRKLARGNNGFDAASINFGNERETQFDVISTGNPELDRLITPNYYEKYGKGGLPSGFLCEFYGPHAGGKSSLCMMLAASATKKGDLVFWVDAEGSFVDDWADSHGVVRENLIRSETGKMGETYLDEILAAASSGDFRLVVVDSLMGLTPKSLYEQDLADEARVGAAARMMSLACPRLVAAAKTGNCSIVFINQIRYKIGVTYGNPETTPGGEALRFFASLRLRLAQASKSGRGIMKDGDEIGMRSTVSIQKSRFGPPWRETVLSIYYGNEKPHPLDMLLDLAFRTKIIKSRTNRTKKGDDGVVMLRIEEIDGLNMKPGIPGIDEFKATLEPSHIKEIARLLVETKDKTLDPEIAEYVENVNADNLFQEE